MEGELRSTAKAEAGQRRVKEYPDSSRVERNNRSQARKNTDAHDGNIGELEQ